MRAGQPHRVIRASGCCPSFIIANAFPLVRSNISTQHAPSQYFMLQPTPISRRTNTRLSILATGRSHGSYYAHQNLVLVHVKEKEKRDDAEEATASKTVHRNMGL
jgi:hypothetical protein